MKLKTILIILSFQISSFGFTQNLSTTVRQDFCKNAIINYYYGTDAFRGLMNITAKGIGLNTSLEIENAVRDLCSNIKLQNEFFKNINKTSRGLEKQQYLSIGMKPENVEILLKYYNQIDTENRKKEQKLSKLENERELKNKIDNNESFYLSELDNKPELKIIDSTKIQSDIQRILNSIVNFSSTDKNINYNILLIFIVDSNGNINEVINKETGEKKPIALYSLRFNQGGKIKNQKTQNVSFYYPINITMKKSFSHNKIFITVETKKGKYNINRLDKSSYASSPAGRIYFEKEKTKYLSHFEALKEHILNEQPIKTTKTSLFGEKHSGYRIFDVSKITTNISLDLNKDNNIYSFENTFFDIVEKTN